MDHPTVSDGADLSAAVRACAPLEPNTTYAYVLICQDFAETSLLVRDDEGVCGFICGYCPPRRPEALFVWQVGVLPRGRGCGLGVQMLGELTDRLAPRGVNYLEATVSPSNEASLALFSRFAESRSAELSNTAYFTSEHFGPDAHEPENLVRIGPITKSQSANGKTP